MGGLGLNFFEKNGTLKKTQIKITNTGNPTVNFNFCVLCLKVYIPAIVPTPPPNAVTTNNVATGSEYPHQLRIQ